MILYSIAHHHQFTRRCHDYFTDGNVAAGNALLVALEADLRPRRRLTSSLNIFLGVVGVIGVTVVIENA